MPHPSAALPDTLAAAGARSIDTGALTLDARTLVRTREAPSDEALALTQAAPPKASPVSAPPEVDLARTPLDDQGFGARYEARALLGEGGMGEVRLYRDQRIGRDVAMKVIRPGYGSTSDARARFEREARVQGQLEHPSVVPVYDLGIGPDGAAFFTMKRIRGLTLEHILDGIRAGDPDLMITHSRRKLLSTFSSVCLAVAFAHARGVIHRDLKPANIMLGAYGELYILDWGLAKVLSAPEPQTPDEPIADAIEAPTSDNSNTVAGALLGSPGYMAPEQARGHNAAVDARADVYALGVILFELLAQEPLHPRTNVRELILSTVMGKDARPSLRAPSLGIPEDLDAICLRATALDPEDRYPSARELSAAIERFLDGDRDLEQRRLLAEKHAAAAEEAMARLGEPGPAGAEAREQAMREVSATLALSPTHPGAIGAMARLLLEAPAEIPPEARAELEAGKRATNAAGDRNAMQSYAIVAALTPLLLWLGVHDLRLIALDAAFTGVLPFVAFWVMRRRPTEAARLWLYAAGMASIGFGSVFLGPFLIVPSLAMINAIAFTVISRRALRPIAVAIGALAVVVPFALQMLGITPSSYDFSHGGLTVMPVAVELPRVPTLTFLLLVSMAMVVGPAMMIGRIRDALAASEERVFMHAWNLRQILPVAARGAALVPAPKNEPRCGAEAAFAARCGGG